MSYMMEWNKFFDSRECLDLLKEYCKKGRIRLGRNWLAEGVRIRFELGLPYSWLDEETYYEVSYESLEPLDAYIEGEVDFFATFFCDSAINKVEILKVDKELDADTNALMGFTKTYGTVCTLTDINFVSLLGVLGGFPNEDHFEGML